MPLQYPSLGPIAGVGSVEAFDSAAELGAVSGVATTTVTLFRLAGLITLGAVSGSATATANLEKVGTLRTATLSAVSGVGTVRGFNEAAAVLPTVTGAASVTVTWASETGLRTVVLGPVSGAGNVAEFTIVGRRSVAVAGVGTATASPDTGVATLTVRADGVGSVGAFRTATELGAVAGTASVAVTATAINGTTVTAAGTSTVFLSIDKRGARTISTCAGRSTAVVTMSRITQPAPVAVPSTYKIWVAVITGYDPDLPGERTLYYSTRGFTTTPLDTPANTFFAGRLKNPSVLKRDMFDSGTTFGRSRTSYGDMILANDDGELDDLIPYGFDGRTITLYCGHYGATFPDDFQLCVSTTVEQVTYGIKDLTFKLRGKEFELERPIQTTKYAGSNDPPAGLEGGTDLKGKPKPFSFGKVFNAPAIQVNASRLIYQIHDSAVYEITDVRDRGISLSTAGPWTEQTSGFAASNIYFTIFAEGLFVIAGQNGKLSTSPDGVTWTTRTSQFGTSTIYALGYGNGIFVAVGQLGKISTSPDGITWTAQAPTAGTDSLKFVYYAEDQYRWFTAGDGAVIYTSDNDWTTTTNRSNSFSGGIFCGTYARVGGVPTYLLGGENGEIGRSNDGITWSIVTSVFGPGTTVCSIARSPSLFLAGGSDNKLYMSPTGITWTPVVLPLQSSQAISEVQYMDGQYLLAASAGALATSSDGITWTNQDSGTVQPLLTAARGVGRWVVGGANGTIITSNLSGLDYGSLEELEDDSQEPTPGAYSTYLAGGYFRLGSSPQGIVTCDFQVQSSLAGCAAGPAFEAVMQKMGKASGTDYSAADITAINTATAAPLGFYAGTQEINANVVLDEIAGSIGAWWGTDATGLYRLQIGPQPTNASVYTITNAVIIKDSLQRLPTNDPGRGLPTYRYTVRYLKNYTVQTTDLAYGVTDENRTLYEHEYFAEAATDLSVQTLHALSQEGRDNTLLVQANDAHGEAYRRLGLYAGERSRYEMTVILDEDTQDLDLGDVVTLVYPRFGLDAGVKMVVVMLEPDHNRSLLRIGLWGGGSYKKYVPIYPVTGTGSARAPR